MTGAELLDQLNRLGAYVELVDGKQRLRGARVPAELLEQIKTHRAAVLAEMEARRQADRDRFGKIPKENPAFAASDEKVAPQIQGAVRDYVFRQGRIAQAWVMKRAQEYHQQGAALDDCEWRAALDLVAWQRQASAREAAEFVSGIAITEK